MRPAAVVLVTFDALSPGALGVSGGPPAATPELDRLAGDAWTGVAVAPSSDPLVSTASLLTGLRPWQHQLLETRYGRLRQEVTTLPEALAALGYATEAWAAWWLRQRSDLMAGFRGGGRLGEIGRRRRGPLAPRGQETFIWIRLPAPRPRAALPGPEAYRDELQLFDAELGKLLGSLRRSASWDRCALAVTALRGAGPAAAASGPGLERSWLEVPLLLRLPPGSPSVAEPEGARVALTRLWATLVEASGGSAPPAAAPSLFHRSDAPILSELYGAGGHNLFSLLEGDVQLLWSFHFASGAGREGRERAFATSEPLGSPDDPGLRLRLVRWAEDGAAEIDDRELRDEMALRLRRRWTRFVERQRPPREEAELAAGEAR